MGFSRQEYWSGVPFPSPGDLPDPENTPGSHTYLNSEFQRIARRDNKALLKDKCREIEKNNILGKTRDLVKKIRNTKEKFHAKMGTIKDRNGIDLTEAEDIKKR